MLAIRQTCWISDIDLEYDKGNKTKLIQKMPLYNIHLNHLQIGEDIELFDICIKYFVKYRFCKI